MDPLLSDEVGRHHRPKMSFRYRLTARGWAEAVLSDGSRDLDMRVSYLSDALRDLLEANIALLTGADQVTFVWKGEPGDHQWQITREQDDVVMSVAGRDYRDSHDTVGKFSARCPLRRFAGQVLTQAWRILEEHGEAGYRELWVLHDFPMAQYTRLERLVRGHGPRHTCPCCGFRTLPRPAGSFDSCRVCGWEADLVQSRNPDYEDGPTCVTLRQAQRNYAAFGASEARFVGSVRSPRSEEAREETWRPLDGGSNSA